MRIYQINQGVFTKSGDGDMCEIYRGTSRYSAIEHFEKLKKDYKGWNILKVSGSVLCTELVYYDDEDDYYDGLCHDPIMLTMYTLKECQDA